MKHLIHLLRPFTLCNVQLVPWIPLLHLKAQPSTTTNSVLAAPQQCAL